MNVCISVTEIKLCENIAEFKWKQYSTTIFFAPKVVLIINIFFVIQSIGGKTCLLFWNVLLKTAAISVGHHIVLGKASSWVFLVNSLVNDFAACNGIAECLTCTADASDVLSCQTCDNSKDPAMDGASCVSEWLTMLLCIILIQKHAVSLCSHASDLRFAAVICDCDLRFLYSHVCDFYVQF